MTAKELRENRAKLVPQIRAMADKANNENRDFTAEEKPNWEKLNKDYDDLTRQIDLAERAEKVEGEQRAAAGTHDGGQRGGTGGGGTPGRGDFNGAEDREGGEDEENDDEMTDEELGINVRQMKPEVFALALQGWMRARSGLDVEDRHRKAARIAQVPLGRRYLDINLADTRQYRALAREARTAQSAIVGSLGATTIAPDFVSNFERAMLAFGGVRNVAEVIRTNTGAEMTWPTTDDTSNEGEMLGENTATSEGNFTTGAKKWNAYKFSSKMIKVPVELLEDSAFDLAAVIGEMSGERVGRATNRKYSVGTGAAQPNGIVTAATLGITAASATAITGDEIYGLVHSVDPAYRTGAGFMFHDSILLLVRKLKDGNGQYLWQAGLQQSEPDRLLGYPYTINQHMASAAAASAFTMLYGQLNKYKVRDVRQLRFRRLVERYADADQEGFVAFFRSDGNLLDAGTHPVKSLQQHA
jgi:HK97 family phage major capsid protein